MIRPTTRLVLLATLGLPAAILPSVGAPSLWPVWVGALLLLAALSGADALLCPAPRALAVEHEAPAELCTGEADRLVLTLQRGPGGVRVRAEALLEASEVLCTVPARALDLRPDHRTALVFELQPRRRGTAQLRALWLRWTGPLGLIRRSLVSRLGVEIPVVPNVKAVRAAAVRHFETREFAIGTRPRSFLGEGSEFDSLREFVPGFDHRSIDWKSSARHLRLLARECRAERNHQMVLAFDTGRLMQEPSAGLPRLDHALNAGLLLAFAGLKSGDRVGFFTFDERVRLLQDPRGGLGSFPGLRRLTARVEYSNCETNFTLGLMSLSQRLARRTLVVLFTEFTDPITAELMLENVGRLTRRHLVLCITLRDPDLLAVARAAPDAEQAVRRAVVADDLLRERDLVLRKLGRLGVHTIDTPAHHLSAQAIDRYLLIKRRELV